MLEQDSHDLRVFLLSLAAYEHFFDTGQADVILMLYPIDLQPFQEPSAGGLHLPLSDDAGDHGLIVS